jgi:hypothetical protein
VRTGNGSSPSGFRTSIGRLGRNFRSSQLPMKPADVSVVRFTAPSVSVDRRQSERELNPTYSGSFLGHPITRKWPHLHDCTTPVGRRSRSPATSTVCHRPVMCSLRIAPGSRTTRTRVGFAPCGRRRVRFPVARSRPAPPFFSMAGCRHGIQRADGRIKQIPTTRKPRRYHV